MYRSTFAAIIVAVLVCGCSNTDSPSDAGQRDAGEYRLTHNCVDDLCKWVRDHCGLELYKCDGLSEGDFAECNTDDITTAAEADQWCTDYLDIDACHARAAKCEGTR